MRYLLLLTTITSLFIWGFFCYEQIPANTSMSQLFSQDSNIADEFDDFQKNFGTGEVILIAVTSSEEEDMLSPESLNVVDQITAKFEQETNLTSVISMTNIDDFVIKKVTTLFLGDKYFPYPSGKLINKPYESLTNTDKQMIREDPFLKIGLLTENNQTAIIWLLLKPELKMQNDFLQNIDHLVHKISSLKFSSHEIRTTGSPIIHALVQKYIVKDTIVFFTISFIISLLIFLFFRCSLWIIVVFTLSIVMTIVVWLMYLYYLANGLHLFSNVTFPFIFIACVPSLIHLEKSYRYQKDIGITWKSCIFSVVTTSCGLATLVTSSIGVIALLGKEIPFILISSFVISGMLFLLFVDKLSPLPIKKIKETKPLLSKKYALAICLLLLCPFFHSYKSALKIESDFLQYLPSNDPRVSDTLFIIKELDTQIPFEIIVSWEGKKKEEFLFNTEVYLSLANFEKDLQEAMLPYRSRIMSPITLLSYLNTKLVRANKKKVMSTDFRVTKQSADFAIYWLIKPFVKFFSGGGDSSEKNIFTSYRNHMQQLLSSSADRIRFGCRLSPLSPQEILDLKKHLEKTLFADYKQKLKATNIYITGNAVLIAKTNIGIYQTQAKSIILGGVVISLLLFVVLRSLKLWIASIIVNSCTVISFYGIILFFGISLNIYTLILIAGIIGIVVDDTIHVLFHFKYYQSQNDQQTAINLTLQKVQPALIQSSSTLFLVFGVFWFSSLPVYQNFAILSQIAITLALFWDLKVLPIVLGLKSSEKI